MILPNAGVPATLAPGELKCGMSRRIVELFVQLPKKLVG